MKTLLWGSLLCIAGAIIYTFRKELGLDKDDSANTKVSSSLAFSAQANALLLDEINKYKSQLSELEGQTEIQVIANEAIQQNKVVCIYNGFAYIYQPTNDTINDFPIGIAKEAVTQGGKLRVAIAGRLDNFTGLVQNTKYYASANGGITSTVPTSGMLRSVGFAMDTDSLILDFGQKIII